jgi:exodeoxyribonuclease-3
MRVATWNVNGIRAREAQVLDWVRAERPEIVCLQEIKATADQVPRALCDALAEYRCYWHGNKAYSGVALHVRADALGGAEPRFAHPAFDLESRIVAAAIGGLVVASVYVPNGGKDLAAKLRFLEALDGWAAGVCAEGRELLVCGDLNVAHTDRDVHAKERRPGVVGQREDERAWIDRLLGRGLVDVGRALDPDNDALFTWWPPWREMRRRNIGWRIDYVLASEALARQARACSVLSGYGTSDHAIVLAAFE